ncbi:YidH family protein [Blastopirellula marina]|uniref:DUF202 domain-containing protein n=1 Tax=Blastopirellula marina TaxID=124 RepID=A0A2S8FLJ6_9BACT|nr:DUF202 domain-containing protein [Blastopirellula marina]PQO33062.1 hypothetical protein C5Y98_18170 [Blastopirellula marina]PTL43229.1 DUF202 domain-containing protein [Blastopirellula marina]
MSDESDPRVFFAAERTMLAWLRTGLAVIGIGFLVARFGLFLRMLRHPGADISPPLASSLIGIGFVLLGATLIGVSTWQHARFIQKMTFQQLPQAYNTRFAIIISAFVALLGMALAVYLLLSVFEGAVPDAINGVAS